MPSLGTFLPAPPRVHQRGSSLNTILLGFYEGFLTQAWSFINSLFSPSPFSREWGQRWKVQASNHSSLSLVTSPHPETIQESTQSCLFRTKDTLIIQKITRVSGALCQEPASETNMYFLVSHTTSAYFEAMLSSWVHTAGWFAGSHCPWRKPEYATLA